MSTPFQNRLVGTIIVTAAIVIFLPGILDGEKKSYQSDFDNIPETPTFTGKVSANNFPESLKPKTEKEQFSEEIAQDDKLSADIVSVQPQPVEKIQAADEMALNKNNVPKEKHPVVIVKQAPKVLPLKGNVNEAWVIQLGSFKNKKNVEQLVQKLKKNGYVVFTKPIQTKKGSLIKVFVGPELIKSSMTKKLPHLNSITGVEGKVANFNPTK